MQKNSDYERINQYIKEFLRFNRYQSTLECFEAEERTKLVTSKTKLMNLQPDVSNIVKTVSRTPLAWTRSQDCTVSSNRTRPWPSTRGVSRGS